MFRLRPGLCFKSVVAKNKLARQYKYVFLLYLSGVNFIKVWRMAQIIEKALLKLCARCKVHYMPLKSLSKVGGRAQNKAQNSYEIDPWSQYDGANIDQ